jgi:hypothetical protein
MAPPSTPHDASARSRRIVGLALVGSAVLLVLAAASFYAGVIPLPPETRSLVATVIAVAGLIDALIGALFLRAASTK